MHVKWIYIYTHIIPAWLINCALYNAVNGVVSATFATNVLPHANAGAACHTNINNGKFHGVIDAITPFGSCKV